MIARERAAIGLRELKEAIIETLGEHPRGLGNAEIADLLELRSDYQGGQKDYLTWSILGLLLNEGRVERRGRQYFVSEAS